MSEKLKTTTTRWQRKNDSLSLSPRLHSLIFKKRSAPAMDPREPRRGTPAATRRRTPGRAGAPPSSAPLRSSSALALTSFEHQRRALHRLRRCVVLLEGRAARRARAWRKNSGRNRLKLQKAKLQRKKELCRCLDRPCRNLFFFLSSSSSLVLSPRSRFWYSLFPRSRWPRQ